MHPAKPLAENDASAMLKKKRKETIQIAFL